jgi:biopolymer transport protein ExbD
MCLIVFYLIVGKLAQDQRSNIPLPVSKTGSVEKTQDPLVINVVPGRAGEAARVVIDTHEIAANELELAIRDRLSSKPGVVVELRASRDLSYGSIASIIRACKNAGIESVRLATERPS